MTQFITAQTEAQVRLDQGVAKRAPGCRRSSPALKAAATSLMSASSSRVTSLRLIARPASQCTPTFSDDANGDSLAATAIDTAAIGTDGLLIPLVTGKCWLLVSEADGDIDVNLTQDATGTWYLILVMPNGRLCPRRHHLRLDLIGAPHMANRKSSAQPGETASPDKRYFIVNPDERDPRSSRENARTRLKQLGYRLATVEEVAKYDAAGGNQRANRPLCERWSADPDLEPEL